MVDRFEAFRVQVGDPPTPRQKEVMDFIVAYIKENGSPPTVREIGAELGISSPNGVMCHIRSLRKRGLLAPGSEDGHHRSLGIATGNICPHCEGLGRILPTEQEA